MAPINWPWAIILCRFTDLDPAIEPVPNVPDYYIDLYQRNGTGGICDYWREVSCNALDLTGSRVFGWFDMTHASSELSPFPGRSTLIQWGIDTARAHQVDLSPFKTVLVYQNFGIDHGYASNGVLIVEQGRTPSDPNPPEGLFGFICHEMGHGMGLPHSWSGNPDLEYGDGWDLMSFAKTTFQFPIAFGPYQDPIRFTPTRGQATVGLNAQNLIRLGAVPRGRTWVPRGPDFGVEITLEPLNQPPVGNRGALVASIPPTATQPPRPSQSTYLVEFRRKAGWDQAIPQDTVLIHEVRTNGISYLQPTIWGQFRQGDQFVTPDPKVFVRVTGIDATTLTASLWIWDLPEGSLRREFSKPKVYLIEHGTKRWVTSPAVLSALGKSFADVRLVPDGQLGILPDGPDVFVATVPDVVAMTRANAAVAMEAASLLPAFIGAADPGAWVWSQSPSGGSIVVTGSTVTMQVRDSVPATVPDVIEMMKANAESAIRAAGLVPAFTGLSGSGAWVSSQSPNGGTIVARGSTVTMQLRTGPIP
jgi:hypothetical protein